MDALTGEYQLTPKEILDELFSNYWERRHFENFDPVKGSFNNWIAGYLNLYLNNLIRQHTVRGKEDPVPRIDPLDQRNMAQVIYADRDNSKEDIEFQPDVLIDYADPESLLIAKDLWKQIFSCFDQVEVQYLVGELTLLEATKLTGLGEVAFRKRIDRRRNEFFNSMKMNCKA